MSKKVIFLIKYYLLFFLRGSIVLRHYLVLLLDNILNPMQISLVLSVGVLSNMFMSLPIGFISSKIGNKKTFILGSFIFFVSYLLLLYKQSLFNYIIYSLASGIYDIVFFSSKESLTYDIMKDYNIVKNLADYRGLSKFYKLLATTIGTFIVGDFVYENPKLIFVYDLLGLFLTLFVAFTLEDINLDKKKKIKSNFKKPLLYLFKHKTLMKFFIHRCLWYSLFLIITLYKTRYFEELAVNDKNVNLMTSFSVIVSALLPILLIKYLKTKDTVLNYFLFTLSSIMLLISYIIYSGMTSYVFLLLYLIMVESSSEITYSKMLSFVPSRYMSTMLSVLNLFMNSSRLIFLNIFGLLVKLYSYKTAFLFISIVFLLVSISLYFLIFIDTHVKNSDIRFQIENK